MARIQTGVFEIDGLTIPYHLKVEYRGSVRYSIGRSKVNIKLPIMYTKSMVKQELIKVKEWLRHHLKENENLRHKFALKTFEEGEEYIIRGEKYTLKIEETDLKSNRIKLYADNIIGIRLEYNLSLLQRTDIIKRLLSRLFSKIYINDISMRVYDINNRYFKEQITNVRLKYNKSNWGSCSSKRNINLSSRLLLAPRQELLDYVIVHELAHLKEMNHSPAFWKIVKDIMPDYKVHEQWLKTNGHTLDF